MIMCSETKQIENKGFYTAFETSINQLTKRRISWAALGVEENAEVIQHCSVSEVERPDWYQFMDKIYKLSAKNFNASSAYIYWADNEPTINTLSHLILDIEHKNNEVYELIKSHPKFQAIKYAIGIYLFKEIALLALRKSLFNIAMHFYTQSHIFLTSLEHQNILNLRAFESKLADLKLKNAKAGGEARWGSHTEELRRRYLELDKKRQKQLGKKLSIKASATWICDHHNPEELELETIRGHLSKARQGIFTNKK